MVTLDAVLLGGGIGNRFSRSHSGNRTQAPPKQFALIDDKPVFIHALQGLLSIEGLRQIVITMPRAFVGLAEEYVMQYVPAHSRSLVRIIEGGKRRQDSTYLALEALAELSPIPDRVLIHDACRPFSSKNFRTRLKSHLLDRAYGAWIPVVPVTETFKQVQNQQVVRTVDRADLYRAQTPQLFEYSVIRGLHEKAQEVKEPDFTDDASICEYFGIPVGTFEGEPRNIKVTYAFELEAMVQILQKVVAEEASKKEGQKKEDPCGSESDLTFTA